MYINCAFECMFDSRDSLTLGVCFSFYQNSVTVLSIDKTTAILYCRSFLAFVHVVASCITHVYIVNLCIKKSCLL